MELHDYPRPKGDTGIGVHWNAGFPAMVGLGKIQEYWLPELVAMGVTWVKLARHDGGLAVAELFLKNDIMPVVRLYRPQPNPGTLNEETLRIVRSYVGIGVRYFEFNNEPDLGVEWQGNSVPPNAQEIVARNSIADIEAILARGGYPGIPATAVGTKWNLVGEICRLGRRDLLSQPVWQAIHNYSLNHPVDYPSDLVNQRGALCSQDEYDRLAQERWDGNAWGGWNLDRVNTERRGHANPGATILEDPSCWRAYERFDKLIRDQIGRSLPILATEDGFVVGERPDPRYPATTPQLHASQTLEACRIMRGTSKLNNPAPDYYFCTAFWLLGNYTLGHWAPEWEGQAWYSGRWPGGRLPTVAALKSEPKQARAWRGDVEPAGQVTGMVQGGAGLTMRLAGPGGKILEARCDASGRYGFADLPLGQYRVTVVEAERSQEVTLQRTMPAVTVNFDLTGVPIKVVASVVSGTVRGGAGLKVRLDRPAGTWSAEQAISSTGSYRFVGLAAGIYILTLQGTSVLRSGITLDGRNEIVIDLVAPGWGWEVKDGGASPGFGIVRCRVAGQRNMAVRLWAAGWTGIVQRTGSKPEYGMDACEFAPLGTGIYYIQPEGVPVRANVKLDGGRLLWVTFANSVVPAPPSSASVISGRLSSGGAGLGGRRLTLSGPVGNRTATTAADGSFRFSSLLGGIYRLTVDGTTTSRDQIALDGRNQVAVNFDLPSVAQSVIFGTIANGAGRTVLLYASALGGKPLAQTQASNTCQYSFERLPAGSYTVAVLAAPPATGIAAQRSNIAVTGTNQMQADLILPTKGAKLKWVVEDGGEGPGFSVVRCRVTADPGRNVRLWCEGWEGITQQAGSKAEYGPDACEFAPLGPGSYHVEPAGLDARAEVKVPPNRVMWIRFERQS